MGVCGHILSKVIPSAKGLGHVRCVQPCTCSKHRKQGSQGTIGKVGEQARARVWSSTAGSKEKPVQFE